MKTNDVPLYSNEAEETIISYVLIYPERILEIPLKASHFRGNTTRLIWSAITRLHNTGTVDLIALAELLEREGSLEMIGGISELVRLMNSSTIGINPQRIADIIRDYASRRAALDLANDLAKSAYDLQKPLKENTPDYISRLVDASDSGGSAKHWTSNLSDFAEDIERRMNDPKDIWGIQTKFGRFDYYTGGLQRGESFLLSGKPGIGKSILTMQMAEQMAESVPGAIYSLEMKAAQVIRRLISANSSVPSRSMKSGRLDGEQCTRIYKTIGDLSELPIFLSDKANMGTVDLHADLSRLKAQHGIQWFVVDYMLLLSDGTGLNETEKTGLISRALKIICRELDLAGVIVHSMNKAGLETTQPDQANLRGSGQVSFDADLICFLTQFQAISPSDGFISNNEQANMRTLFFAKGRELENPIRYIHLVKLPNSPKFADYEKDIPEDRRSI